MDRMFKVAKSITAIDEKIDVKVIDVEISHFDCNLIIFL